MFLYSQISDIQKSKLKRLQANNHFACMHEDPKLAVISIRMVEAWTNKTFVHVRVKINIVPLKPVDSKQCVFDILTAS